MLLCCRPTRVRIGFGILFVCALAAECGAQMGPHSGANPTFPGGRNRKKSELMGLSLAATGEDVVELRIVGNKTIPTSQIVNQIQTRRGRPFDPKIVQRDVRKLASLSWFVDVKPLYEKTPAGRIVIFQVVERPTIRYVEFLGNQRIRDKTLTKEIDLTVGGAVDPFAVEDGRRKITALYKKNGFNKTQISVLEGNKATDQGVVYIINEGVSQRIWDVDFVGANFVSARRLKTRIQSKPPMMLLFKGFVDREQIEADTQALTDFYRSFGFYQAKVGRKIEFNDQGTWANLTFVVDEGPRYEVRNVSFMGNQLLSNNSLEMGLRMPAGKPFERANMNNDIEWLKELYGSQGYVFADIRAEQVLLEEPGQLDLVYHIEEGKRWRVGRILVNINGEHTHSRIQTALNRLSLKPGEILDIREVRASERRLQASGLFLTDPVQGVAPKITFRIPELESIEFTGDRRNGPAAGMRGQSPDPAVPEALPNSDSEKRTYEVRRLPLLSQAEVVDVYLDFSQSPKSVPSSQGEPEAGNTIHSPNHQPLSATAVRHVAMRPPLENVQSEGEPPSAGRGTYDAIVVRTQSPFQPAPVPGQSVAPTYGGQLPGATGPQSAPVGYHVGQIQPSQQVVAPAYLSARQSGSNAYGQVPPPQYAAAGPVQPVQYVQPLPAPVGNAVAPSVAPGSNYEPPITPLPAQPGYYPGVPFTGLNPYSEPNVDVVIDVAEAPTGRFQIGAGINSDAGVIGNISLDERNFDWRRPPRSLNDFATGRAWRGAGQRFRLEAAPGTIVQRYLASFSEPYLFDSPISFGLSGSYFERRFRDWDEERLGGRASLGYQWVEYDLSATLGYRGELVKIYDAPNAPLVPSLEDVMGDNTLHGFRVGFANDTRDSAFFPTQGHLFDVNLEQVLGDYTYARAIIDIREYGLLHERPDHSGRHVLSGRSRVGFSGRDTPIYDNFFAGGFSTLRGFDFRGASPVYPIGGGSFVEVGGQFMWINSLEYLFPLTADDMIHGVVFVDFGTVESSVKLDMNSVRVAPGFGLRMTVPAMGPAPIALDFAWGVKRAEYDDLQVFSFNVGFTR